MAFKLSTGLRQALLSGSGGLRQILTNGYIHIYSGTPPTTADDAITGTLLATIYSDAALNAGINFDAPAGTDSEIRNAAAETWNNATPNGTNVGTGTATHFLLVDSTQQDGAASGTTAASTSAIRILGTVGTANADLNLSSTSLTAGQVQAINSFSISIPETL